MIFHNSPISYYKQELFIHQTLRHCSVSCKLIIILPVSDILNSEEVNYNFNINFH